MKRREFIALLGGGAAVGPLAALGQQPTPLIGLLHSARAANFGRFIDAFHGGLKENGFIEGQTIAIEQRWAEGQYDRLPALAADLVTRRVVLIATMGGEAPALAAKNATSTIPIVFVTGGDPVKLGLVSSLNRPNANVTGINQFTTLLESKRFGLLHQMVPAANPLAILVNPTGTTVEVQIAEVREAAAQLGVEFVVLKASREPELADAFATLVGKQIAALQVAADPFFFSHRRELVGLAARHKISAIYEWRDFADVGGLMSYGTNLADSYRLAGEYVGRMLRGTKPADLPVTQSTRFEFVINLKTAKTLGIEVPPGLSSMADEMIE